MTASAAEAPDTGRTPWPVDAAVIAAAAYAAIQAPAWNGYLVARAERERMDP